MATVVVLMPSALAPETATLESTQRLIRYSSCKCATELQEWAAEAAELAKGGRQKQIRPPATMPHHPSECPKGKSHVIFSPSYNCACLHWARNESIREALTNYPNLTHLLLVDSDMAFEEDSLDRLLAHGVDIVSGLATKRIDPPVPVAKVFSEIHQNYASLLEWRDERGLLEVDAVGAAFLLLTRKAVEETAIAYHQRLYRETGNGFWFEYLRTPQGVELGEDVSWCLKSQRLGYKIWLDTDLEIQHLGKYQFGIKDWNEWRGPYLRGEVGPNKTNLQLVTV